VADERSRTETAELIVGVRVAGADRADVGVAGAAGVVAGIAGVN